MAARREERMYRSSCKKCVRGEATTRLLEDLIRKRIGLKDIEEFIIRDRNSSRGGGEETFSSKIRKYEEERVIVENLMRKKLRESSKNCILLRKQRQLAEKNLMEHLGGRNRIFRGIVKDVKKNGEKLKMVLMKKNVKKCKWLQDKYGMRYEGMEEISNEEYKKYGEAELFKYNCKKCLR